MERLLEGYRRFRKDVWPAERARYESLARLGQSPHTMVVSCSDSRVDPQTVFGAGSGELFVVRNVAALVPPYEPDAAYHGTSAGLEFAVRVLKVARIVILGHADCGGVRAMVQGAPREAQDFVEPWMRIAASVLLPETGGCQHAGGQDHYEHELVRLSVANLATFPWIASAVADGRLEIHGLRFDIRTGILSRLQDGRFEAIV